jgi:hypothetical protein
MASLVAKKKGKHFDYCTAPDWLDSEVGVS